MQILLPPSETKREGGVDPVHIDALAHSVELGPTRERVRTALEELCADEEAAAQALKLGARSRGELSHNLTLATSGALPAVERYTGVLYDALEVRSLEPDPRGWVDSRVSVQSALFGTVSAADRIPAYRLSASSRIPGLGSTLKALWSTAHRDIDWQAFGWVLDLRSKDYAALNPLPDGAGAFLHVAQRGPDGAVRALNHFNKAAKGDLVRRLAVSRPELHGIDDFLDWAAASGLDAGLLGPSRQLTLVTDLGAASAPALSRRARSAQRAR